MSEPGVGVQWEVEYEYAASREESHAAGWLIAPGAEPWSVPVAYYDGVRYLLHDEDYRTPVGILEPWGQV